MKRDQILKIFGTDYREMTIRLLEKADLAEHIPEDARIIGIKPNLVAPTPASYGATTHPEIVAGIVEYLQREAEKRFGDAAGFDLRIMEGSWVGDRTTEAFEVCGYTALAKQYGVTLVDAQQADWRGVDCGGTELKICSCGLDADYMINVPVMKGHSQTKITCALKNMKGLIPNEEKRHFHAMGLMDPLGRLGLGLKQDFIVVDHICGDLDFEDGGNPTVCNCIMAALDPVLIDAYICRLLHYDPMEVPYVKLAADAGQGSIDAEHAQIICLEGEDRENLPAVHKIAKLTETADSVDACSACYNALMEALNRLEEEKMLAAFRTAVPDRIHIGQGWQGKNGAYGIGNCTSGFAHNVPGCPPTAEDIYRQLLCWMEEKTTE